MQSGNETTMIVHIITLFFTCEVGAPVKNTDGRPAAARLSTTRTHSWESEDGKNILY